MDPRRTSARPKSLEQLKCIRYMVNSTPEFIEVLHTVNGIVGALDNINEVEKIQRASKFSIIPLPHSQSKFIACFEIPSDLLGLGNFRRPLLLNFSEIQAGLGAADFVRKQPLVVFSFLVKTLYDINLSICRAEAVLARGIPQPQWTRVRRSINIDFKASSRGDEAYQMVLSAEANPAFPNVGDSPR